MLIPRLSLSEKKKNPTADTHCNGKNVTMMKYMGHRQFPAARIKPSEL